MAPTFLSPVTSPLPWFPGFRWPWFRALICTSGFLLRGLATSNIIFSSLHHSFISSSLLLSQRIYCCIYNFKKIEFSGYAELNAITLFYLHSFSACLFKSIFQPLFISDGKSFAPEWLPYRFIAQHLIQSQCMPFPELINIRNSKNAQQSGSINYPISLSA